MRTTLFTGSSPHSMGARVNSQRRLVPGTFLRLKYLLEGNEQQSSVIRSHLQERYRNGVANYLKGKKVLRSMGFQATLRGRWEREGRTKGCNSPVGSKEGEVMRGMR